MYAFQRAIPLASSSGLPKAFCPSSRAFPLLFQRKGPRRTGGLHPRMIKLPIDSHLFSAPRIPLLATGHRCYGRPQNENNSRKAACASIYIPHSPPSTLTSLLVSSVPFRRNRNPTFEHATSVTSDEDELPRCSIKRLFRPR